MNSLTHWIFGYGSLLWNPGFVYQQVEQVCVPGWARRMWQGSTDHRGTPEYPGVVCTLVALEGQECVGRAYAVRDEDWPELRLQLDYREKDGYQLERLSTREGLEVWCYVARPDNPSYLGQPNISELARRIARAQGPSGTSLDYFLRLRTTLAQMGVTESHFEELWQRLGHTHA